MTSREWRERSRLCLQEADKEASPIIRHRLASHALALADLAERMISIEGSLDELPDALRDIRLLSESIAMTDRYAKRDSIPDGETPSNARVMLVEDEAIVALNLRQRLVKLGYEICATASSGAVALEKIEQHKPDLVLMDINISGDLDGIETAAQISPDWHIPVIYLTAYSEEATLERARVTKPYGYLLKPFSEREMQATIQMALEQRHSELRRVYAE